MTIQKQMKKKKNQSQVQNKWHLYVRKERKI